MTQTWPAVVLGAWDLTAAAFVVRMGAVVIRFDADRTKARADEEDPRGPTSDLLLVLAAVASLAAVGFVVVSAHNSSGLGAGLLVALAAVSVVLSWLVVHIVFTLRYARLYFDGRDGGVDFNQKGSPRYSDFAYLAFTIGMTFQVSDTDLTDSRIRRTALRHALLSYLFGAVIIAGTINLIAGLTK